MIIRAFEADELQMLNDIVERQELEAIENNAELTPTFVDLKESLRRANQYVNVFNSAE